MLPNTPVPKVVGDVTLEWMQHAMSAAFPGSYVRAIDVESSVGDLGYMGSIGRVVLSFAEPNEGLPTSVIVKCVSPDEEVSCDGKQVGAYETEARFYQQFANRGVGRAPQHYFSVYRPQAEEFLLIIEDLKALRFGSQLDGASVRDCAAVLRALAKMHATFWESQDLLRSGLGDIKDWEAGFGALIEKGAGSIKDNFSHLIDPRFMASWREGIDAYAVAVNQLSAGSCTLMHGDAHIRNLAFDDVEENPVRFYDWQLAARGPAAYDVLYFLATSMRIEDHAAHLDQLLELYLEELQSGGVAYSMTQLKRDMQLVGVTFWGYVAFLGNLFPVDQPTLDLVRETAPRYTRLVERFDSYSMLNAL